jgi:hypothetical protein
MYGINRLSRVRSRTAIPPRPNASLGRGFDADVLSRLPAKGVCAARTYSRAINAGACALSGPLCHFTGPTTGGRGKAKRAPGFAGDRDRGTLRFAKATPRKEGLGSINRRAHSPPNERRTTRRRGVESGSRRVENQIGLIAGPRTRLIETPRDRRRAPQGRQRRQRAPLLQAFGEVKPGRARQGIAARAAQTRASLLASGPRRSLSGFIRRTVTRIRQEIATELADSLERVRQRANIVTASRNRIPRRADTMHPENQEYPGRKPHQPFRT